MTKKYDLYKCNICGAIHQALHDGAGNPSCCDQLMTRMKDNFVDAATEKHIPVIKKLSEKEIEVIVGEVEHPMSQEHFIEWIEVKEDNKLTKIFLGPEDAPKAVFSVSGENYEVRAYCNLHGLWRA